MRDKHKIMRQWGQILSLYIWIWVIFGASGQSGEESGHLSQLVINLLYKIGMRPQLWLPSVNWHLIIRKAAHFFVYMIMGLLIYSNLMDLTKRRVNRAIIILLAGIVLAALDEYHQSLVPGRGPSVYDVMIDGFGVLAGVAYKFNIDFHKIKCNSLDVV